MTRRTNCAGPAPGFTLIELLVALLILSIMAAMGYSTYRSARISADRTEDSLKRSREIEFGLRILVQDIAATVPRPVRDVLGESRLAAMHGTPGAGTVTVATATLSSGGNSPSGASGAAGLTFDSGPGFNAGAGAGPASGSGFGSSTDANAVSMLDLTRSGWSNTAGQQRGTLQRVSYALVGDVLKRSYQVNLDTVLGNKPVVQDLLTGVKGVQLRYLDGNQTWQSQWPAATSVTVSFTQAMQSRPVAVEVIIQFKDWGAVRRLIEVAG